MSDGNKVSSILDIDADMQYRQDLSNGLNRAVKLSIGKTEEKLKNSTISEFEKFFIKFGIDLQERLSYEETSIGVIQLSGRGDVFTGKLINEFKSYGLLDSKAEYEKAVNQVLKKYLEPINKKIAKHFHAVLFDGKTIVKFQFDETKQQWKLEKGPFNDFTLIDWVLLIDQTSKRPVSSKSLSGAFSIQTEIASNVISLFYTVLKESLKTNKRVKMLFDEWDKSFSYIYGGILNDTKIKDDFKDTANQITLSKNEDIQVDMFLFCFYTYYALIIKLYASEISSFHLGISPDSPVNALLQSESLFDDLRDIESGNFFKEYADIDNYIEGGFFSWYLDAWNEEIELQVKTVLNKLNEFDFKSTLGDAANSRDILKNIYQNIIPQKIRHDLGEYYTPDWVIKSVLNNIRYDGTGSGKLLDPGCGSGGFLVEAINRIKLHNIHAKPENVLAKVTSNIIGFDVNPVAVLTARTNYLMAISSLLEIRENTAPITLPVYLADAIITPTTEGRGKINSEVYWISTVEGLFSLPKNFVDSLYLNKGMRLIEECLISEYPVSDFEILFKKQILLEEEEDLKVIFDFYRKVNDLHAQGKNRIWVKIILNSFAPLMFQQFQFVVGNPPWIKWDFLSQEYKKKLSNLYLNIYKLFSHRGMKAGMGYSHDDISVVFMYVALDKYLKIGGKLGFVMKQTLYKSIAGNEFRKFAIEKGDGTEIPLKVLEVNDLLAMKPFRLSAQAETSTIILEKGYVTSYPVKYNIWTPKASPPDEVQNLDTVLENTLIEEKDAYPLDPNDAKDVWITVQKGNSYSVPESSGENYYNPRHGIVNDLNGVFFIEILSIISNNVIKIRNQTTMTKKKVKAITTKIELDLVYPFLKPRHVKKWYTSGYNYCILPQTKTGQKNESSLRTDYPLTYNYLHKYKDDLERRSSRWFKTKGFPFYSIFGIGDYSFLPYKVVWNCMSYLPNFTVVSTIKDQYIGEKKVMPDNTIGSISVDSEPEAHYICAILNSKTAEKFMASRSSKSKWGISIETVRRIPIPKYDPASEEHTKLVGYSKKAHKTRDISKIEDLESLINTISARILTH